MKKSLLLLSCLSASVAAFSQVTTNTFSYTGAVQTFTVPPCVTSVNIQAMGAQGGAVTGQNPFPQGGLGATMAGDFTVTPGDVLTIVVGGRGNSDPSSSGGGGGSGVNNGSTILIVAGGGGGVDFQDPNYAGQNAVTTQDGVTGNGGSPGAGGTAGGNGGDHAYTPSNISRGGNGWNIGPGGSTGTAGTSSNTTFTNGSYGLGGGGGSVGYGWCNCGGGGGGYSGGGSADINNSGGGGGSYNVGANQVNTAGNNTGNGLVIISYTVGAGAPPTPGSISGSSAVCAGTTGLTYSIATVPGATGYSWTVPSGSTITGGQGTTSITVDAGSSSGNVTVTADNACASSSPATFSLTINALPTVTASAAASSICAGSSDVLTAGGASTYAWSSGGTTSTETVSPTSMTTYTVTGTDANGCVNTATVMVMVNALPNVTASAANGSICNGGSDVLTANGASTYAWSSGGTASTETVMPSSTSTYTVTGTDANGCVNTATVSVTVNANPNVSATAATPSVCMGSSDVLTATGASTYVWSSGGTAATETVSPTTLTTYTVTGTDANGCTGMFVITVNVNPLPTVTGSAAQNSVCLNDASVTLTGSPAGGTWSGAGVTANMFSPMTAGNGAHTLTYSFTDANGCSNTATVTITVNACTGVEENGSLSDVNVYPNPNNGQFSIVFGADVNDVSVVITDLEGRIVNSSLQKEIIAGGTLRVDLGNEANGIYMMKISANGGTRTEKIIVQK